MRVNERPNAQTTSSLGGPSLKMTYKTSFCTFASTASSELATIRGGPLFIVARSECPGITESALCGCSSTSVAIVPLQNSHFTNGSAGFGPAIAEVRCARRSSLSLREPIFVPARHAAIRRKPEEAAGSHLFRLGDRAKCLLAPTQPRRVPLRKRRKLRDQLTQVFARHPRRRHTRGSHRIRIRVVIEQNAAKLAGCHEQRP